MNVQATHIFAPEDLRAWLDEHGLDADQIRDITIHIENTGQGVGAWAHVTWYKRDAVGNRYFEFTYPTEAATGEADLPLRSLPRLMVAPL